MVSSPLLAFSLLVGVAPTTGSSCYDSTTGEYSLKWKAEGKTFFDDWNFETGQGDTHGSAVYLDRDTAFANNVIQAHDDHAILRVAGANGWQRHSANINTPKYWDRFLTVLKFNHVPYGAGIWPAFWSNGQGSWPDNGELDYLEYANNDAAKISMHVGKSNPCKLSDEEVNKCGSIPDEAEEDYDCFTDYSLGVGDVHLGCGPTSSVAHHNGSYWAANPGIMAVERTDDYVKVFYIPTAEIPSDLESDQPEPNSWDRWVVSYFPFTASERRRPGSCPNPTEVLKPQQFVLNIETCGDWAGSTWEPDTSDPDADMWWDKIVSGECIQGQFAGPGDCCTEYLAQSSMDGYLGDRAYFNISYMKIYQQLGATPTPSPPSPRQCTAEGQDPFGRGLEDPCCDGLLKKEGNWDGDGRYYHKCMAGVAMPTLV